MSEKLTIEIDGKACECEYGEYLYDVATRNGIFIPKLCRSDAFEDHRACCRICIVEVETRGRTKVVTSIESECIVRTNSERIKEERAVLMALLKCRAPESENIAQMAGALGGVEGFERLVSLDSGKCILCGLCVQACNALGTGAISTVNRGVDKEVSTPYGSLPEPCVGCLSCANVCPTGHITFEETADTRTIWDRCFELVKCESCGAVMGTKESVAFAADGVNVDEPVLCDACRKRKLADEMMQTYRYV